MDINKNNVLALVVIFGLVLGLMSFGGHVIIEKVAQRVIEVMRRDYSPGPYAPGFDPDKVDPNFYRQPNQQQMRPQQPNNPMPMSPRGMSDMGSPSDWNRVWQQQQH